jgi:hypothetical protein
MACGRVGAERDLVIVPWTLAADFAQLAAEAGLQGTAGVAASAAFGRHVSSQERAAAISGLRQAQNTSGSHPGRDR